MNKVYDINSFTDVELDELRKIIEEKIDYEIKRIEPALAKNDKLIEISKKRLNMIQERNKQVEIEVNKNAKKKFWSYSALKLAGMLFFKNSDFVTPVLSIDDFNKVERSKVNSDDFFDRLSMVDRKCLYCCEILSTFFTVATTLKNNINQDNDEIIKFLNSVSNCNLRESNDYILVNEIFRELTGMYLFNVREAASYNLTKLLSKESRQNLSEIIEYANGYSKQKRR